MSDIAIVGAGVIGLSLAYELAGRGLSVRLFDQYQPGQEASWAGAGMLPPGNPTPPLTAPALSPAAALRAASHALWTDWAQGLLDETGIDTGYRRCGSWELRLKSDPHALDAEIAQLQSEGILVEPVHPHDLPLREPALSADVTAAYHLPEFGQVRNPRLLKALLAGCLARGVRLHSGTSVHGLVTSPTASACATGSASASSPETSDRWPDSLPHTMVDPVRVQPTTEAPSHPVRLRTTQGDFEADHVLLASGAWTSRLLPTTNSASTHAPSIRPLKGQMLLLNQLPLPLTRVINIGSRYIVPRGDGRILVGSTQEAVGFDKRTTAAAISELLAFAIEVVPALARAQLERAWAGLRPQSADGLPYLGRLPGHTNLWIAAGHFRDGLQLSPVTAVALADALLNQQPLVDLTPYAPDRAVGPSPKPKVQSQN